MTDDIPALVQELKQMAAINSPDQHTEGWRERNEPEVTWQELHDIGATCGDAAAALSRLSRALAERDALLSTGSACEIGAQNPNVASYIDHWEFRATTAEKTLDEIRDWRATVTAALGREGGAHYPDVPKHIREMRRALDSLPGHTCHVSSDTCGGCEYAMERDHRLMDALRERDEARAALAEQAKHDCDDWLNEGMGCALCNHTAIALREAWSEDPVRKERDALRLELDTLKAHMLDSEIDRRFEEF